jgi:hypothetical protein
MNIRLVILLFTTASLAHAAQSSFCQPSLQVRQEIQHAERLTAGSDPMDFEKNVAPFRQLRAKVPTDLFVHERYQSAVEQHGIEGHLRDLTQEYQRLALENPDDVMYRYLAARSLIGRSTLSAISALNEILMTDPGFAPAHASLAEIYASDAFHDEAKEQGERGKFVADCPSGDLSEGPAPLPSRTGLIDQAEQLLANQGNPDRAAEMALQGIREDEWRLQRVRSFDWYTVSYKQQILREVKTDYWKLWSLQVRCYRKSGQTEKEAALMGTLERRALALTDGSVPSYWEAQAIIARLCIEGNLRAQASHQLDALGHFLEQHPDPARASQLADLRRLLSALEK